MSKTVKAGNLVIGEGRPKICIPIMGKTAEELENAARSAVAGCPDLVEWRADFFEDIESGEKRKEAGERIRKILGEIPLLFTIRTRKEGGEADFTAEKYLKVMSEVLREEAMELADVEITHGDDIAYVLISMAHERGIKVIASSHDFEKTPKKEQILMILCKMQELEADIPKVAVMPQSERDVLNLLDATLCMKELHGDTPVITMSMGKLGTVSRLAGEVFGSAITFGTAGTASAPGQIDAGALRNMLQILKVE